MHLQSRFSLLFSSPIDDPSFRKLTQFQEAMPDLMEKAATSAVEVALAQRAATAAVEMVLSQHSQYVVHAHILDSQSTFYVNKLNHSITPTP